MIWAESEHPSGLLSMPGLHALVKQTLLQRGMKTENAARGFLDPDSFSPSPATDLPGLSNAVDRVVAAIHASDPICVWGDFDVDGQTSTTVLVQSLKALGAKVSYHIPVRQEESHGVNVENLARVIAGGAKLVVTCDTGISAHEAVNYARSRGVDMVITDHHDLPAELPAAFALVNPKMLPQTHPLATLAGVGVAYKLVEGLTEILQPAGFEPSSLLDLVALGLVADLAILRSDSRFLVQKGLAELRQTRRVGLKTMMELAELSPSNLTEEHIGFTLGPRLNALGRLGDANPAVELLTTSDQTRAHFLATQLEGLNAQRKLLCDQVYQAAEAQLRNDPSLLTHAVIVLAHPAWPGGVVGIVASKIVERYHKPAILMTAPAGQPVRGSARSIEGLNITEAIAAQKDILIGFGGHPMAAGLSLEPEKFTEFRHRLSQTVEKMLGENISEPGVLAIESWLELEDANLELAGQLESLAPFGPGNAKPILACRNLVIKSSTKLGKNKEHLKLTLTDESGVSQQVLWWDGAGQELPDGKFDLAFTLRASDWRGSLRAQMEFVDFRQLETGIVEIKRQKIEILDMRAGQNQLDSLLAECNKPDTVCWAEGSQKQILEQKQVIAQDRKHLYPAQTLILWTIPPSYHELRSALELIQPQKVIVYALDPGSDDSLKFRERLMGLIKTVISKKNGQTSYSNLAAATAQNIAAVRSGLDWMAKRGLVTVEVLPGDNININLGGNPDESAADTALTRLNSLLSESSAFRKNFKEQAIIVLG